MKIILIRLLPIVLLPLFSIAQEQKDTSVGFKNTSIGLGVGMGQEIAVNLFGTVNFKRGFYFGLQYLATSARSKEVPDDYTPGTRLFTNSTRTERDHFEAYSLMLGQRFQKEQSRFSVSIETGLSFITYSFARFQRHSQSVGFLSSSGYFATYDTHHVIGWLINGRLGYRIGKDINLELSTYTSTNSARTIIVENLSVVFDLFGKQSKTVNTKQQ
ncbi:MAG: hypothetical protein EOP45_17005 [Sphingobacteriaceae bacterium]|nr:MAG: hypothetical protein EOP45_17005 [Sphingobacteriaceae bacterium]